MRRAWLIGLLLALAAVLGGAASANPPAGDASDPDVGKLLYNLNIVAMPQGDSVSDDSTCRNRILFERVSSGPIGDITWQLDPAANGLQITDCDGTADKEADILVDEEVEFWVMIRVAGAKTDSLDLTCLEILEQDVDDLCLNNGVKLTYHNDKAFTKVMFNVSDNAEEEVEWGLSTSTGFRMAQVRVYEKL